MSRLRNAPDITCENQAVGLRTMARASDDSARMRAQLSYVLFDCAVARSSPGVDLAFVANAKVSPSSTICHLIFSLMARTFNGREVAIL